MTAISLSEQKLRRVVASMPDAGLAGVRNAALQRFLQSGLPTRRDEDWKYTDLSPLAETGDRWLDAAPVDTVPDTVLRQAKGDIDAHWIVFANGHLIESESDALTSSPVSVEPLAPENAGLGAADAITELNTVLSQAAYAVKIPRQARLERPIALLVVDHGDGPLVASTRVDIVAAEGCSAEIIELYRSSGGGEIWSNNVVNLELEAESRIAFVRLQERHRDHDQTARLNVTLGRDSRLEHFAADLGSRLVRNDLRIDLAATDASARFDGVYVASDGQHIDNHTRAEHRVGPSESRQEYRGIVSGNGRCVWNGKAIVHAGADGSDARQVNHNLMLSDGAEIDAKPELEIYADEVKCSHGTTVGQLDERAQFYLRSRGIGESEARRILTRAFAAGLVASSPIPALRESIAAAVETQVEDLARETAT